MQPSLSVKQKQFIYNATSQWNIAHGSVSTGKTYCTLIAFFCAVDMCPDTDIAMVGHTSTTIYQNAVRLLFESPVLSIFRPFCTWFSSKRELHYKDKVIATIGAKDEGAIGLIQGRTLSLVYCDEMTLYPDSVIDMIDTRLRKPHSMGFASMNPSYPDHKIKQWIDKGEKDPKKYYSLHFVLEDNPYLPSSYIERVKNSLSGVFYKRNYLGLWCLAEGSIFEFFDKSVHVIDRPKAAAEYFIAGIDYGLNNPFACVLIGVSTGKYTQTGKVLWVEDEFFWDQKKQGRQKTVSELAEDVVKFLEPYNVRHIYVDPSALPIKRDLQKMHIPTIDANNDVLDGIGLMTSEMRKGNLFVLSKCTNLIREIESYVWDSNAAKKGWDQPIKKDDHAVDALRYAIASHKVATYQPYKDGQNSNDYQSNRFNPGPRRF